MAFEYGRHTKPVWGDRANGSIYVPVPDDPEFLEDLPVRWHGEVGEVCGIPLWTYGIALGDLLGKPEREGAMPPLIRACGRSVHRVHASDPAVLAEASERIKALGGLHEPGLEGFLAVDSADPSIAARIDAYLREQAERGLLEYEHGQ